MSNYGDENVCTDDIYDDEQEEDNFKNMPMCQPNFGKKSKPIDPSTIKNISQIPNAYILSTERGSVVNINGETFPITLFSPRIINELQARQAREEQQMQMAQQGQVYHEQPTQHYGVPNQMQHVQQPVYHHAPTYQQQQPQQQVYYPPPPPEQQPIKKMIDLTDADLNVDEGSSYSRKKPEAPLCYSFLKGWNKSVVIIILLVIFFNEYTDEYIKKVPYLTNQYAILAIKILLIAVINHVIIGYFM